MADKTQEAASKRTFSRDETAGATLETALLLSLAASFAWVMRSAMVMPLLQKFTEAARVLGKVLG
jgi:hypothetical protein